MRKKRKFVHVFRDRDGTRLRPWDKVEIRSPTAKLQFEHFKKSIPPRIFKDLTIRGRMLPFLPGGSYFVGGIIA